MVDKMSAADLKAALEAAEKREADEQAEKDKPKNPDPPKPSGEGKDEELGEAGKKALQSERDARKAAEDRAKAAEKDLKDLKDAQAEAERKAAEEAGNYKVLYEKLQTEHQALKDDLAKKEHDALRTKVAAEFNLPTDLAERLAGTTEADLKADAEKLAKLVKTPAAPNTETGNNGGPKQSPVEKPDPLKAGYTFVPANAVPIPQD